LNECIGKAFCPVERYGLQANPRGQIADLAFEPTRTSWTVLHDGKRWADFEFSLAGEYNV